MRKLTKDARMQADSLPEIRRGLDRMAYEYGDQRVGNRPVSEGHVLNAALLVLMGLPDRERGEALRRSFGKLNALLALDDPAPDEIEAIIRGDAPAGVDSRRVVIEAEVEEPRRSPRRKGAG